MTGMKRQAEAEVEAGPSRSSGKKSRLGSASAHASEDVPFFGFKHGDASSSNVASTKLKENKGVPRTDKGKRKAPSASIEDVPENPCLSSGTFHLDTLLTPNEREAHNTQRRATRHQAAYDPDKAHEQRVESGLKHSPIVEDALQNVLNVEGDLAFVQSVVAKFCEVNHHSPIPPSAEVWAQIPPQAARFLASLARAPTSLNLSPFIADGTLVLSSSDDAPPVSAYHYYIRVVETAERTKAALMSYLLAYPANAANTVLQLLLQGEDITLVHTQFRQSMELHGLESAVDVFIDSIRSNAHVSRLAATCLQMPSTYLPYVGLTNSVPCAQRAADDISQNLPVVFVNFLNANPTLAYTVYRIPSLDTPTQTPSDLRTNPVIGHKERILRALLGCSTLNSAPGGGTPIFEPTAKMIAIQDRLTASLPPFDFPLGEERDEALQQRIKHLIDNESVKLQVASVLRLKRGRLVRLNMAKDIPLEGILGKAGYWDAGVGPGPQEDRHLRCLLDDAIPPNGDLSEDVIARWIGPLLNFWRCTLSHLLYLLHLLLLARFLAELRPLLIFAQSNPVSAALRSGDLALSTNSLPEEVRRQFFEDCKSSPELLGAFPSDVRYRRTRGSAFNQQLGRITLIPIGVDPALLALLVSMPDCGELKYDPALAPFRWNVDFLVCLVARAVTHRISSRLDSDVPDWSDATASKAWLLEVKADAESILQSAGVTAALEVAKSRARRAELAVTFLRTVMSSSRGGSKNDYKRRAGLEAAAGTEARTIQLNLILAHAQLLDSLDLPPDPDHLAPFEHPILSETFPAWFLGLKDGTEIVQSANAHGRSVEAVKAVKERHAQFVNSNCRTELSILQTAQNGMIEVMRKLMRPQSYMVKEIKDSARLVHCDGCDWSGLGFHNFSFHNCRSRGMLTITESNFPDLERVLYVHEILHDRCSLILGDLAPVLAQLQLIAVPIREILLLHKEELKSALCDMDVAAILSALQSDLEADLDVYVTEDDRNNIGLLVTLAVDVVLRQRSRCPVLFVPMDPEYRQGWSEVTADQLQHWFRGDATPLYIAACPGPDGCKRQPHVFVTTKASLRQRRSVAGQVEPSNAGQIEPSNATHSIKGGRACNNCIMDGKNEKNCVGRRFLETETILDLPPHFSRAIWYQYRLGVEWPAPRISKKRKAKRK
ncbi:hypothetical protein B0H14DRAFT_3504229 [Mycena olivaceomarginata]|nr:hypothetical protein B0H14DRAFT_3504229 [Mycena olivaceomarginata]